MAVSVNMPHKREDKDPLDTILKGLTIAQGIYGIKEAGDKAALLKEEAAAKRDSEAFNKATGQAAILKAGFEANKQEDGSYALTPRAGFRDLETEKTRAEIEKLKAEAERAKRVPDDDGLAGEIKRMRVEEMKRKEAEAAFAKTPEGRLKNLNSGDKQRLDNAKLGLTAVQGMADSLLRQNQNTFSVIGDNDFTQQRTLFEEALGRMQSGGAITAEEANRFKAMAPTFRDSEPLQRKKLMQLQAEMQSRLNTLGFRPDDLGVQVTDINKLQKAGGLPSAITGDTAYAGEGQGDDGGLSLQEKAQKLLIQKQGMKAKLPGK